MESEDHNTVFWIERRRGGRERQNVFLQATPIDVAPILKTCLFDQLECAVLTSATLAVGGGFDYIRKRLGLEQARELVLPSHFDYENQALFYVPADMPDPRTPQFAGKAADCIRRLLEISRGRAFVLFTSYAQMNDVYQRLLTEIDYPMLRQGDAPKSALLEEFRITPNAVLFATSSFWQGVDVQGEQLSCVIIDRLPFAVPSDPVVAARVKSIDAEGGNAFFQYQVPAAVITLKQGFGRLIRSLHDRGLLVLLDNRILKKQYGRVFVESLPNYRKTTDLRQVEEFFGAWSLGRPRDSAATSNPAHYPSVCRSEFLAVRFRTIKVNRPWAARTNRIRSPGTKPIALLILAGMVTLPRVVSFAVAMYRIYRLVLQGPLALPVVQ
jgi:ATP-dependent DNA helicase DinG